MNAHPRPRPQVTATALYALGLLALFSVALTLGGGETHPARWALIAIPVILFAAASLTTRRARVDRAGARAQRSLARRSGVSARPDR